MLEVQLHCWPEARKKRAPPLNYVRCALFNHQAIQISIRSLANNPLGHIYETFFRRADHYADSIRLKRGPCLREPLPAAMAVSVTLFVYRRWQRRGFAVRMISACKPPRVRSLWIARAKISQEKSNTPAAVMQSICTFSKPLLSSERARTLDWLISRPLPPLATSVWWAPGSSSWRLTDTLR